MEVEVVFKECQEQVRKSPTSQYRSNLQAFALLTCSTLSRKVLMADSDLVSALKNEVLKPLRKLSEHEIAGFTPQATKALSLQTDYLDTIVRGYMDQSPTNPNQPGNLENSVRDADLRRSEGDQIASGFLEKTETAISTILSIAEQVAPRTKLALDHLNDALVQFLIIFERHNLASPSWLKELLNTEKGVEIIFNYVARRFPGLRDDIDVFSAYLITDFKKALQESPFTAELKGLFTYFDRPGWHGLERSHISSQISAYERAPKPVVTHVTKGFPQAFMIATQPGLLEPVVSQPKQNIAELMSILANLIGSISRSSKRLTRTSPIFEILSLKILHSMVRFLARYHISEALNEEGVIPRHMKDPLQLSWLEEFDETIVLFSATLKSVYLESGQTMQKLDSFSEINQSIPMIYLTDIVNTPPWIFTARNFGYSVGAKEKEAAFKDFPQLEHFGKMVENISKISHATAKLEPRDRIGVLQKVLLHPENFINA
ncbi:hypothetical protein PTTG_25791 [Puccinia triticina 1-1 BBBD Race 1]|uniref:Uncharacterized protein n=1 Tax=Puccinia triticina (isolate 1-1 / race 1 (BBBD)) TaxID=630390 RepID=A0A180GZ24_PUCT1|nr:hypothetical protein PTTG_25791 [Puccinia triticina 1-1 BBBD Race 1]